MPRVVVRTTHLELISPDQLVPAREPSGDVRFLEVRVASPEFNRFFYTTVGADHYWRDRLPWTWLQWHDLVARPDYETWYLTAEGSPAGYVEIDARALPNVELAYFGLLPLFIGRGLGGWLLERATRRGFQLGSRVWLHTCTLDGPNALPAYRRRGYHPFKVEEHAVDLPARPPEPWPGADRPGPGAPR